MFRYEISEAKVLKKGLRLPEFQQGKEITIYFQEGNVKWKEMFQEIETFLSENNIAANYKPLGDMQLNGGQFLSCRCDLDGLRNYVSSLKMETHNPSGKPHLFESINIVGTSQIVKPVRKNEARVKSFYADLEIKREELLSEFRKKIILFDREAGFYRVTEHDIVVRYGKYVEGVMQGLKKIVSLGQELELILKNSDNLIESMEEENYFLYVEGLTEKYKAIQRLIEYVYELIEDNPLSSPHSSEGSVVIRDNVVNAKRSSSEEGASFSDDADKSFEKHEGIPDEKLKRYGLFLHVKKDSAEKQKLFTRVIPETLGLGVAKGKGDCFYDACAQELNEIFGTEEYSLKGLRLLCHTYAVELDRQCGGNPNHEDNWIARAFNDGGKYQQYLANVKFTVEEREAGHGLGNDRLAIWGESHIDGKIICKELKIKLHVIEVRENPDDATNNEQKFIVSHNVVDESRLKNVDEKDIDWEDKKTVHIAVCNLHFVPILKKILLQESVSPAVEIQKSPEKFSPSSEGSEEAAANSTVDESSSFSGDFKHRSAEAEESPRTSEDATEETQPKSPRMRR